MSLRFFFYSEIKRSLSSGRFTLYTCRTRPAEKLRTGMRRTSVRVSRYFYTVNITRVYGFRREAFHEFRTFSYIILHTFFRSTWAVVHDGTKTLGVCFFPLITGRVGVYNRPRSFWYSSETLKLAKRTAMFAFRNVCRMNIGKTSRSFPERVKRDECLWACLCL